MEVIVLKPFMANGQPQPPGTVIDLPTADAAYVIGIKRAERVEASPASAPAVDAPKSVKTPRRKAGA